jgi:hypothetical protein
LLAQALFNTQGELLRGISGYGSPFLGNRTLDAQSGHARWSPTVRQRLYQFQLASALHMDHPDTREDKVTLWRRTKLNQPVGGSGRPKYEDWCSSGARSTTIGPPPCLLASAPGGSLEDELQKTLDKAALRPERTAEILTQVNPPYAFFAAVLNLQPGRRRRTFELLAAANTFASVAGQQFSMRFASSAGDRSPLIQPMVATPGQLLPGRACDAGRDAQTRARKPVGPVIDVGNLRAARPPGRPHRREPRRRGIALPGRQ